VKLQPVSLFLAPLATTLTVFAACSSTPHAGAAATTSGSGGGAGTGGAIADGGTDAPADAGPSLCTTLGLASRPFITTGTGPNRGDLAADFTLPLVGGTSWTFSAEATGCESYVFLPDLLTVSQTSSTSIWASAADLASLVSTSPMNVHYFFVSQQATAAAATTSVDAMAARITALVGPGTKLTAAAAAHWQQHLHVVAGQAQTYTSWVGKALIGWGTEGFCIDRRQTMRGVGFLSDVTRQIANPPANVWPFDSNLAYAANEAIYMNSQSDELDRLDAEGATVVPVFTGQVLSEQAYTTVTLPSNAAFDTLEVEVTMACPDPTAIEFNSCGAWDYIASLYLDTPDLDAGTPDSGADAGPPPLQTELARFITSYHRETHWVEDITPMMALLPASGPVSLDYSFAPSWNVQPTAVTMSLRYSNQKKGYAPATVTSIATGATWDDMYNAGRTPVNVTIPADTLHAELWILVTGHGSDGNGCGEFCNSEHQFTVNGAANTWLVQFPMAGTEEGCMTEQTNGMVPNQGGTWWYGRDGWCPGEQVTPHVWDVTAIATPGSTAVVTYEGLFDGATPPVPTGTAGNIVLTSYLATFH
jgi:Peptide-N-glycosidase F, C terminal